MGDALVGADRAAPDLSRARVLSGEFQRSPRRAVADGRAQDALGFLDAADVGLLTADGVAAVRWRGGRRDVVTVRARVGLGDGERDLLRALADRPEPALLLIGRAVPREDAADDRGRHDDQE